MARFSFGFSSVELKPNLLGKKFRLFKAGFVVSGLSRSGVFLFLSLALSKIHPILKTATSDDD